jgi:hypothetical protein
MNKKHVCSIHPGEIIYTAGMFRGKCDVCVKEFNFQFFGLRDYLDLKRLAT